MIFSIVCIVSNSYQCHLNHYVKSQLCSRVKTLSVIQKCPFLLFSLFIPSPPMPWRRSPGCVQPHRVWRVSPWMESDSKRELVPFFLTRWRLVPSILGLGSMGNACCSKISLSNRLMWKQAELNATVFFSHDNIVNWEPEGHLSLFNYVPLRTRRVLSLYKVYGNSALLVLNGT